MKPTRREGREQYVFCRTNGKPSISETTGMKVSSRHLTTSHLCDGSSPISSPSTIPSTTRNNSYIATPSSLTASPTLHSLLQKSLQNAAVAVVVAGVCGYG
ncbi:hypothetical protein Bca4012_026851 [Brassica carinata]